MLSDLESVFVIVTDKIKPNTIKAHIDHMCALKLLSKKGELSYKIVDNWRDTIKQYKKY